MPESAENGPFNDVDDHLLSSVICTVKKNRSNTIAFERAADREPYASNPCFGLPMEKQRICKVNYNVKMEF